MTQRQEIIERLNGLELEGGSHEMLNAVCKAVLPHGDAWTLRRCWDLRDRLVRLLGEADDDGFVRLPKDADGEYIHVGDVMDGIDKYNSLREVTGRVITISFEADGLVDVAVQARNDDGKSWRRAYLDPDASVYRHHYKPTVEDVLREFALRVAGKECMTARPDVITEYAAKLRLTDNGKEQ